MRDAAEDIGERDREVYEQVRWIIGEAPFDEPPRWRRMYFLEDGPWRRSLVYDDRSIWFTDESSGFDDEPVIIAMGGFPPRRFRNRDAAIGWLVATLTGEVDPRTLRPGTIERIGGDE